MAVSFAPALVAMQDIVIVMKDAEQCHHMQRSGDAVIGLNIL